MDDEKRLMDLMIAYQNGEAAAFDELYRLTKTRLHQYLITRTLDRATAEDLLQETFLQIHRSRKTYLRGKPVGPWIYAIARHVHLTYRRRRTTRLGREEMLEDQIPELPIPPQVEENAGREEVWRALRELPEEQREVTLLHHYWGFSFKEVGGILGIRAGTAKVRAHRALLRLRKYLSPAVTKPG